jgi:hypothetical protein
MKNTRRDLVKDDFLTVVVKGVPGVGPPLEAGYYRITPG